jgi:hypothetical protein
VEPVELAGEFALLAEIQIRLSSYEFYRALTYERTRFPELISESLMSRILGGARVTREEYEDGHEIANRCRARLDDIYRSHDVLISPSAPGEAPRGLESTGDPIFGLTWTLMHGPAITLPVLNIVCWSEDPAKRRMLPGNQFPMEGYEHLPVSTAKLQTDLASPLSLRTGQPRSDSGLSVCERLEIATKRELANGAGIHRPLPGVCLASTTHP